MGALFPIACFLTGYAICYIWNVIPETEGVGLGTFIKNYMDEPLVVEKGAVKSFVAAKRLPEVTSVPALPNIFPPCKIL